MLTVLGWILSVIGRIFGNVPLSTRSLVGVIVFTVVEVVTLTYWLIFALQKNPVASLVVLAAGLLFEHYFATQVGQQDK